MSNRATIPFLTVALAVTAGACADAPESSPGRAASAGAGNASSIRNTPGASCVPVKYPGGVNLTSAHPGYTEPMCAGCHTPADLAATHEEPEAAPAACSACHGPNGAPHVDHAVIDNPAPCTDCHDGVEHAVSFEQPVACVACHDQCD